LSRRSSGCGMLALALLLGFGSLGLSQQPPGPPPPPPGPGRRLPPPPPPFPLDRVGVANEIARTRSQLSQAPPADATETEIFSEAGWCLTRAQGQLARNQVFSASRLAGAGVALADVFDRLQHRVGPPGPPPPPEQDLSQHLIEVYFRVRQADYFSQQSHDAKTKPLAALARWFYEKARQAFDQHKPAQAEEYAGAAEDVVRALEFLAQSTVQTKGPPALR
jgi:hypothetical protein